MARVLGVKASLVSTEQSPLGRLGNVVKRRECGAIGLILIDQLVKLFIVNKRVPLIADLEFGMSEQNAIRVLMLACYLKLVGHMKLKLLHKADHFLVPGYIAHGQGARVRLATIGDTFDLNKVWPAQVDQISVLFDFLRVPAFNQSQSVDSSLLFISQGFQAVQIALPKVLEQWSINTFQAFLKIF